MFELTPWMQGFLAGMQEANTGFWPENPYNAYYDSHDYNEFAEGQRAANRLYRAANRG